MEKLDKRICEGSPSLQKLSPLQPTKLKRMSRASEKIVLEHNGTGSAEKICDIVRDMVRRARADATL